jgi:hypothetical protein
MALAALCIWLCPASSTWSQSNGSFLLGTNSSQCRNTGSWVYGVPQNGQNCGGSVHSWTAKATQQATISVGLTGGGWAAQNPFFLDQGTPGAVASFYRCSDGPVNGYYWYSGANTVSGTLTTNVEAGTTYCVLGAIGFWDPNTIEFPDESFIVSYTGFDHIAPIPLWTYVLLAIGLLWVVRRQLLNPAPIRG